MHCFIVIIITVYYILNVNALNGHLYGRGIAGVFAGDLTYYGSSPGDPAPDDVHGVGACGRKPDLKYTGMFAALNGRQFNPYTPGGNPNRNPLCHTCIKILCDDLRCIRGASVVVQLVDSCPPCKVGDIDVSLNAMAKIVPGGRAGAINAGRLRMRWTQVNCNYGRLIPVPPKVSPKAPRKPAVSPKVVKKPSQPSPKVVKKPSQPSPKSTAKKTTTKNTTKTTTKTNTTTPSTTKTTTSLPTATIQMEFLKS